MDMSAAQALAQAVSSAGGRTFAVGGWVRDQLAGQPCRDLDLEIHGISESQLQEILSQLGTPLTMGKSFGIYSLAGTGLDISLPRNSQGLPDPFCGPRAAARRRDFTCNAMMKDLITGELLDFYGGQEDLDQRILRHIDDSSFSRDPLRVLRCARLAARLSFTPAADTLRLCSRLDLSRIAKERVFDEVSKALTESARPSLFFGILREMDQLQFWFPELQALIGVPQPPRYHGEGDVWNHTMLVLDAAVPLARYTSNPLGFLLSALCHDFGKALTTASTPSGIHAYGHETAGIPLTHQLLQRLSNQKALEPYVANLVKLHMQPNALAAQGSSQKAFNRMFDQAEDPKALLCLAAADDLGRITEAPRVCRRELFSARLRAYAELMQQPQVTGEDLIQAGICPGPDFGSYLQYAHKLHLSGVPRAAALKQTLAFIRRKA